MIVVTPNNTSGVSIFGIKFACLTRKYRPHVSFYPRQQIAPIFRLVSCQEAAAAVGAGAQFQFNSVSHFGLAVSAICGEKFFGDLKFLHYKTVDKGAEWHDGCER